MTTDQREDMEKWTEANRLLDVCQDRRDVHGMCTVAFHGSGAFSLQESEGSGFTSTCIWKLEIYSNRTSKQLAV